jgi:hypothetical protein
MKLFLRLSLAAFVILGAFVLSQAYFGEPAVVEAQQLSGEAAREYLAKEGILAQLEGELGEVPPQGRNFGEPPPTMADDGLADDQFGASVAVAGDTAVVGSPFADVGGEVDQGAAYVFKRNGSSWSQDDKLVAVDGAAGDKFGTSVAVDGETIVVGAEGASVGGEASQGAAYVFTLIGPIWVQQQKLVAGDGALGDSLGTSVGLAGDTAVVGARFADVSGEANQGAAYVFTRSGTIWTEQDKLEAGDGAAGDNFGISVALNGDTAVLGSSLADVGGDDRGAAYVFTRSGINWSLEQKLMAADGADDDQFGREVGLDGDTAVVGAFGANVGGEADQGAAYVFTRSGASWSLEGKLVAEDGAAGDSFGISVAVLGDTALVGATFAEVSLQSRGAAYVFTRSGSTWSQAQKLAARFGWTGDGFGNAVALDGDTAVVGAFLANMSSLNNVGKVYLADRGRVPWPLRSSNVANDGGAEDRFGFSVAISGDTAIVGALNANVGGKVDQGAAYVFVRSEPTWSQQQKLVAADGAAADNFGSSVAVDGNTAVVGARFANIELTSDQGAAYVFNRSGTTWTEQDKLVAVDGTYGDEFGVSVAIEGDTVLVGAWGANWGGTSNNGAAYVFTRYGTSWSQEDKLVADDGDTSDYFGNSVGLDGDTAIVGANRADVGAVLNQGAAYVFTRSGTTWNQEDKLLSGDGASGDRFGNAVAVEGDTAVVGAREANVNGVADQGAAYVFTRNGTHWTEQDKLVVGDGSANDNFGRAVALDGGAVVVGALFSRVSGESSRGAAYVFTRSGPSWSQQAKLIAEDGAAGDYFGSSAALDGDTAIVGAYLVDVSGTLDQNQGRVYFFERQFHELYLPLVVRE